MTRIKHQTETPREVRFTWPTDDAEPELPPLRFARYGPASKLESMLRAALGEFLDSGEATSPERIAERAGAGPGTFYRLFKPTSPSTTGGQKARCFDLLFNECWYVVNQLLMRKDSMWDFSQPYTAERVLLEDVEVLLRSYQANQPERDALTYLMQTSSRPTHLSWPELEFDEQSRYEDRHLELAQAVIAQNTLTDVTPEDILNFIFTTLRTTITAWAAPGGDVLKLEAVLDHIRSYLRGDDDGGGRTRDLVLDPNAEARDLVSA